MARANWSHNAPSKLLGTMCKESFVTSHRRPDITARFRAIVARAIERADREEAERLAAIRAIPLKRISLEIRGMRRRRLS